MSKFTPGGLNLLNQLAANNNKDWFGAHRDEFKTQLQDPFADLLESISFAMEVHDIRLKGSKKTMFRLHRDVRFSKDKTPYNLHISGMLTRGGTKTESGGGLYVRLDRDGGRLGCGHYGLDAKVLAPIRQKILDRPNVYADVLADLDAAGLALDRENTLTTMPRGFSQYGDHPHASDLKLKSFTVFEALSAEDWLQDRVIDKAVHMAQACQKLLAFRDPFHHPKKI
ncbi:DUF2461 domain-containing protein [Litorimonas sp. RW-G-Af-16]|uniref:DUF2461 domain-containing protein n=1 Tax=Litorimonas sp. RW-G-Af-16 TaxID=3241168 RepID=UPI00390CBC57